jgi:hypothetical protein
VESADNVVEEILHKPDAQDKDRLKAADMVYERMGAKAPQKSVAVSLSADIKDFAQFEAIALEYDEKMKSKLLE